MSAARSTQTSVTTIIRLRRLYFIGHDLGGLGAGTEALGRRFSGISGFIPRVEYQPAPGQEVHLSFQWANTGMLNRISQLPLMARQFSHDFYR
jgi:hypothetical protein